MAKISVAVVGATGYGGAEIIRLLSTHPCAEVVVATSGRLAGQSLRSECPWLASDLVLSTFEPETLSTDFVFLCQEKGFAMDHARVLLRRSRIIDLSADFRLQDVAVYKEFYGIEHRDPDSLVHAAYGLPELIDRAAIANANLVAVPGCYPTAASLALAPLADILTGTPIVDAKSGVSGAGRSRKETEYLFSELSGSCKGYALNGHRHTPEIERFAKRPVRFTPHLLPTARGILATVHAPVSGDWTREALVHRFRDFYAGSAFVSVVDQPPTTKQVLGSNRCDLHVDFDARTGYAIVCSVIDNLVKGAAGQAIQNLNLMAGLPETTGLPLNAVWP